MRSKWTTIVAVLALAAAAGAQTTALTYQGRLKSGGEPASGLHDFRFRLFDAGQGGSQLGSTQCLNNLSVADGLFTAAIDFGQQFASPDQRFLEIQVREDTGLGCGNGTGFVTLNPRQPLTAAPLASHANSAFTLDAADGGPERAVFVDNAGKVGIGTQAPTHSVHVAALEPTLALQDTDANGTQVGFVSYRNANNVEMAWVGYGSPGSPNFSMVNARSDGNIVLFPISGNVGILTDSPQSALEVRGDIRLGASGDLLSAGGVENLRIIRGTVAFDGTILDGEGFSCQHLSTGDYLITFTTPFAKAPTITASPDAEVQAGIYHIALVDNVFKNEARVYTALVDNNVGYRNRSFHFIAVGPR